MLNEKIITVLPLRHICYCLFHICHFLSIFSSVSFMRVSWTFIGDTVVRWMDKPRQRRVLRNWDHEINGLTVSLMELAALLGPGEQWIDSPFNGTGAATGTMRAMDR